MIWVLAASTKFNFICCHLDWFPVKLPRSAAPRHTRAPSATSAGGRGRTRSAPTTRHQGEGYQVSTSGDHRRPQPPPDPPLPQNQINYLILQQVATRSAGAALRSIGMCWLSGIPMINPEITATGCSPHPSTWHWHSRSSIQKIFLFLLTLGEEQFVYSITYISHF